MSAQAHFFLAPFGSPLFSQKWFISWFFTFFRQKPVYYLIFHLFQPKLFTVLKSLTWLLKDQNLVNCLCGWLPICRRRVSEWGYPQAFTLVMRWVRFSTHYPTLGPGLDMGSDEFVKLLSLPEIFVFICQCHVTIIHYIFM